MREETGRGAGGSKSRQMNRAKLEDSDIRSTVKHPGHEMYSIKEYLTKYFWHLPQDLFSFSDPGVPLQLVSPCLSEGGCELHLEVVPRPLSTLSSKGFYFLWPRMPLACCSQSLPWLTPHDSPNARTASLCIWRVTTRILHHLGLQPRSVAWPLESSVSCQGLCLHFATCSC